MANVKSSPLHFYMGNLKTERVLTSLRGCGIMDGQNNLPIALRRCKWQRKEVNYKEEDFCEAP